MYLIYISKLHLALNNPQWLICHKPPPQKNDGDTKITSECPKRQDRAIVEDIK